MSQTKHYYNSITFILFIALLIGSFTFYGVAQNGGSKTIFEDFDGDGLSNSEEESFGTDPQNSDTDGDGYSDGVEIESGYDPLIPAPGDRVISQEKEVDLVELGVGGLEENFTDEFASTLNNYLVTADAEGEEFVDQAALDAEVEAFLSERISQEELPIIEEERIYIKGRGGDNLSDIQKFEVGKQESIKYVTAFSYIMQQSFPEGFFENGVQSLVQEVGEEAQFMASTQSGGDYFSELTDNLSKAENSLYDLAAPEEMLDIHVETIQAIIHAKEVSADLSKIDISSDALSFFVRLLSLQQSLTAIQVVSEKMSARLLELGIVESDLQLPL